MATQTMRWVVACVVATGVMAGVGRPALAELPEEGAAVAPADAAVFIEVEDLAALRAELEEDPLVEYLRDLTPARREPAAWRAIQDALGLSGEEIFDRYFGSRVVLVGEGTEEGGPGVLLSRVEA